MSFGTRWILLLSSTAVDSYLVSMELVIRQLSMSQSMGLFDRRPWTTWLLSCYVHLSSKLFRGCSENILRVVLSQRGSSRLDVAMAWLESIGPPKNGPTMTSFAVPFVPQKVSHVCCCMLLWNAIVLSCSSRSLSRLALLSSPTAKKPMWRPLHRKWRWEPWRQHFWTGDEWKEAVEVILLILIFCLAQPTTWIYAVC